MLQSNIFLCSECYHLFKDYHYLKLRKIQRARNITVLFNVIGQPFMNDFKHKCTGCKRVSHSLLYVKEEETFLTVAGLNNMSEIEDYFFILRVLD